MAETQDFVEPSSDSFWEVSWSIGLQLYNDFIVYILFFVNQIRLDNINEQ